MLGFTLQILLNVYNLHITPKGEMNNFAWLLSWAKNSTQMEKLERERGDHCESTTGEEEVRV